eukprot:scaffold2804_cov181-Amphora_coffeaeformis.AAC.23
MLNKTKPKSDSSPAAEERIGIIDGLRFISALVVLVSHIGALDPDLSLPDTRRQLLDAESAKEVAKHSCLELGGDHVLIFLVIAGFCAASRLWKPLLEARTSRRSDVSIDFMRHCQCSLIKRFFRLGLPLVPVHITHIWLARHRLAEGPYHRFPSDDKILKAYSVGVRALWSSALSGQLWILEELFLAPFIALALQLPVVTARPRSRIIWYLMCMAYLAGNVRDEDTVSLYCGTLFGVILADMYHHNLCYNLTWTRRFFHAMLGLLVVGLPWYWNHTASFLASSAAIVYLVVFIAPKRLQYLLDNPVVQHCVRYAYELYIWHILVFSIFSVNVRPKINSQILYYVAGFSSCMVVSILTFYLFEVPSFLLARSLAGFLLDLKRNGDKNDTSDGESSSVPSSSTDFEESTNDEEKAIPTVWDGIFL